MDDDIEIGDKILFINDVLAFIFWKMKIVDIQTVQEVAQSYFTLKDLKEAKELLHERISFDSRPKVRSKEELVRIIGEDIADIKDDDHLVFLAKDLNHLPGVDLVDKDAVRMFLEQARIQEQLKAVLAEQTAVKQQLSAIALQLERVRETRAAPTFAQCVSGQSQVVTQGSSAVPRASPDASASAERSRGCSNNTSITPPVLRSESVQEVPRPPRGYAADQEGFMTRIPRAARQESSQVGHRRKRERPYVTGVKEQGKLKPTVNDVRIFATKLSPDESEEDVKAYLEEFIDSRFSVKQIKTRTTRYASFLITTSRRHEEVLLDPNTWELGVQVRYFYGQFRNASDVPQE